MQGAPSRSHGAESFHPALSPRRASRFPAVAETAPYGPLNQGRNAKGPRRAPRLRHVGLAAVAETAPPLAPCRSHGAKGPRPALPHRCADRFTSVAPPPPPVAAPRSRKADRDPAPLAPRRDPRIPAVRKMMPSSFPVRRPAAGPSAADLSHWRPGRLFPIATMATPAAPNRPRAAPRPSQTTPMAAQPTFGRGVSMTPRTIPGAACHETGAARASAVAAIRNARRAAAEGSAPCAARCPSRRGGRRPPGLLRYTAPIATIIAPAAPPPRPRAAPRPSRTTPMAAQPTFGRGVSTAPRTIPGAALHARHAPLRPPFAAPRARP